MPKRSLPSFRVHALLSAALIACATLAGPAHAVKLMDLRAEQLMIGADSIRKDLALTPNQQTLWQQSVSRAQALLRTRQQRRDRLQAELKAALASSAAPQPDLRDFAGLVDAEEAASAQEDRALRELWLTVNDALTDDQRRQVIGLLVSQLERVEADGPRGPGSGGGREGGKGPGGGGGPGGRGQRPGGGMGGGSAGMGGMGGP